MSLQPKRSRAKRDAADKSTSTNPSFKDASGSNNNDKVSPSPSHVALPGQPSSVSETKPESKQKTKRSRTNTQDNVAHTPTPKKSKGASPSVKEADTAPASPITSIIVSNTHQLQSLSPSPLSPLACLTTASTAKKATPIKSPTGPRKGKLKVIGGTRKTSSPSPSLKSSPTPPPRIVNHPPPPKSKPTPKPNTTRVPPVVDTRQQPQPQSSPLSLTQPPQPPLLIANTSHPPPPPKHTSFFSYLRGRAGGDDWVDDWRTVTFSDPFGRPATVSAVVVGSGRPLSPSVVERLSSPSSTHQASSWFRNHRPQPPPPDATRTNATTRTSQPIVFDMYLD
eukprot:TRINITY_DN11571_c0_g1_i2.p1 TRINITY_DN11571_c0_g1~~TRINITY_DN11571_c0_g1_i2.p1  ORF type:complete len:337 (+),score=46.89 TRINITY_DN11571_c0_g1_i2:149-1159(+)